MWTRNNDVLNRNMLKHFIYSSSSKSTTSLLCSLYYRYSSKVSSFFCILSFLVIAISIDQTFYSATHYLAAVWLDSRHDFNITSFAWSYVVSSKNVTMFSVIEKTMTSQSKKQYESCYETSIDFMIYSVLSFRIETFSSYRSCDKVFVNDWRFKPIYQQSIIQRSTISRNKLIKMLNANFESTAITCRMTELNDFQWWNSVTISIHSWLSRWSLSTSIETFTFEWVSIQIRLITKRLINVLRLERSMTLSFEWASFLSSIINNWKRSSRSLKLRWTSIDETSSMK